MERGSLARCERIAGKPRQNPTTPLERKNIKDEPIERLKHCNEGRGYCEGCSKRLSVSCGIDGKHQNLKCNRRNQSSLQYGPERELHGERLRERQEAAEIGLKY